MEKTKQNNSINEIEVIESDAVQHNDEEEVDNRREQPWSTSKLRGFKRCKIPSKTETEKKALHAGNF